MASSQVGTELEALNETHIGDLSEAYNAGVLSPAQEGRWSRFESLVGKFKWMFWLTSSISSQNKTVKDLARMHAEIAERNAMIARGKARLDELAECAEIAMLTERAASDSGQNAWSAEQNRRNAFMATGREETDQWINRTAAVTGVAQDLVKRLANQPPNLILNVYNTFPKSAELWAFAMIGMALQLVAVAIPAIMTYHWRKPKGSQPVQDYAYPTFLLGTCLLVMGIALCSYIIEATTVEQVFIPTDSYRVENIFRLQVQQNMGDQPFKAYVILNHAEDKKIRTSRYDPDEALENNDRHNRTASMQDDSSESGSDDSPTSPRDRVLRWYPGATSYSKYTTDRTGKSRAKAQKSMVIVAVMLCFVGFICQFVGLRALHWSATVIQLGITLSMTFIRAWIRRGISNQPITFQLPNPDPNWIALSLGTACRSGWPSKDRPWPRKIAPIFRFCEVLPETCSVPVTGLISIDDPRIQLRRKLQSSSTKDDSDLLPQARALLSSMREFFLMLRPGYGSRSKQFTWSHIVQSNGLTDSSLQKSRLKLTMSFGYEDYPEIEQEVLIFHALLSILRYESSPSPRYRCITRVYTTEDLMRKIEFLVAQLNSDTADGSWYEMKYLSTSGHLFDCREGHMSSWPNSANTHLFAGMSIENLQPATGSRNAGSNSLCGYLLVSQEMMATPVLELLTGFMDAVCHEINPKYDHVTKRWYVEYKGKRQRIKVEEIVANLENPHLMISEMDARTLVIASLARCSVWKDSAPVDEPNPASIPLPKPDPRAPSQ